MPKGVLLQFKALSSRFGFCMEGYGAFELRLFNTCDNGLACPTNNQPIDKGKECRGLEEKTKH